MDGLSKEMPGLKRVIGVVQDLDLQDDCNHLEGA